MNNSICSHSSAFPVDQKRNRENASSDEALGKSERKRKLDVEQSCPDLRVHYASEEEIIKNVVLSKRHRSSRQIGLELFNITNTVRTLR